MINRVKVLEFELHPLPYPPACRNLGWVPLGSSSTVSNTGTVMCLTPIIKYTHFNSLFLSLYQKKKIEFHKILILKGGDEVFLSPFLTTARVIVKLLATILLLQVSSVHAGVT